MMVQLYEGCFGLTRGGDGVPQEVVGPAVALSSERAGVWHKWRVGGFSYGNNGGALSTRRPFEGDIIRTFPDRASAEAALAGGEPLPGRLAEPCGGCGETNPARRCLGCHHPFYPAAPCPAEPAQAGVDWERRRWEAMLAALNGMLAHSTRYRPSDGRPNWHSAIAEEARQIADRLVFASQELRT